MSDYLLLKITVLEHGSVYQNCRIGEDIITIICDIPVSPTPTQTQTMTLTPTNTSTVTPTVTTTTTETATPTTTKATPTPTSTLTNTPTVTPTVTLTQTPTTSLLPSIVLNFSNNWTYNLTNNTVLKFNPLNSSYNNVNIVLRISNLALIPNNALPNITNITFGIINFGQLIYNGPIFENKPIILTTGSAQYLGNITSQNTAVS